ncbi:MAG: phosphoglycerate dehydrogenase [candidate division KSB1 bacterium]|nr:phosphoglycerate dehydrogenase [candidate division KSB1 bacterium]
MYKIKTYNKISPRGLDLLPRDQYEVSSETVNADGYILRSYKLHDEPFPESLLAIARAGAGVNNIPVDDCTKRGIVVFNTPGANANGVKELVLCSLFLASRKIVQGVDWAKTQIGEGDQVPKLIEKNKSQFAGPEIKGKRLGIIGLGAIGVNVANDAYDLGMDVIGFDPFLSVDSAWGLSRNIQRAVSLDDLVSKADYISIHAPLTDKTRGMFNAEKFSIMKKGVRILNFARGGLVNNNDIKKALDDGIVTCYVTDFPDEELLKHDSVIGVPHLGASTPESEDNCAIMAATQLVNYLECGNVVNSVNFPDCEMQFTGDIRLIVINQNIPAMVQKITGVLADRNINISNMLNRHQDEYAYNIIDIEGNFDEKAIGELKAIDGIIAARVIECK